MGRTEYSIFAIIRFVVRNIPSDSSDEAAMQRFKTITDAAKHVVKIKRDIKIRTKKSSDGWQGSGYFEYVMRNYDPRFWGAVSRFGMLYFMGVWRKLLVYAGRASEASETFEHPQGQPRGIFELHSFAIDWRRVAQRRSV